MTFAFSHGAAAVTASMSGAGSAVAVAGPVGSWVVCAAGACAVAAVMCPIAAPAVPPTTMRSTISIPSALRWRGAARCCASGVRAVTIENLIASIVSHRM